MTSVNLLCVESNKEGRFSASFIIETSLYRGGILKSSMNYTACRIHSALFPKASNRERSHISCKEKSQVWHFPLGDLRARWYNHFSRQYHRKNKYFSNNMVQIFFLWGRKIICTGANFFVVLWKSSNWKGWTKKNIRKEKWKIRISVSTEATKTKSWTFTQNFLKILLYKTSGEHIFVKNFDLSE